MYLDLMVLWKKGRKTKYVGSRNPCIALSRLPRHVVCADLVAHGFCKTVLLRVPSM